MKHDAAWFIAFFEAIPDCKFVGGAGLQEDEGGCALWQCGVRGCDKTTGEYNMTPLAFELAACFGGNESRDVWRINDGLDERYQQPTPKARILAALHDAQKKGL